MPGPGRDQVKAMSRLVRIIAVLDNAGGVGASAQQLIAVAEYGQATPEDQLSQDLRNLRKQGWQIDNLAGPGEPGRYRMISGDNRLRVRLSADQMAALRRAVILSQRSDLARRLGVEPGTLHESIGSEVLPDAATTELSLALQAVQLRSRVRFSYKGAPRDVHPGRVRFQNNQWYLSGTEDGSDLVKHFMVSRMSDVTLDEPGTATAVPAMRRIPLHPLRWEVDEPTRVTLRTTPEFAPDVVRWLMEPERREEQEHSVDMTYTVTHRAAFCARIYMLDNRVRLVGDGPVREDALARLRTVAGL